MNWLLYERTGDPPDEAEVPRIVAPVNGTNDDGGCKCPRRLARGVVLLKSFVRTVVRMFISANS